MKNIFLQFPDEQAANSALFDSEMLPLWPNLDVIGVMVKQIGEDSFETLEGYHVNLAADSCPEELQQYEVFPTTPSRVFGGLE